MVADNRLKNNQSRLIETGRDFKLLPTAIILGANASGKSNVLKAFQLYCNLTNNEPYAGFLARIHQSNSQASTIGPFLLNKDSKTKPISMEAIFWDQATQQSYQYGFVVQKIDQPRGAQPTWQFQREYLKLGQQVSKRFATSTIFERSFKDGQHRFISNDKKINTSLRNLLKSLSPNVSAISLLRQFEIPAIQGFFDVKRGTGTAFGHYASYFDQAVEEFKDPKLSKRVKAIIRQADLSIRDMRAVQYSMTSQEFHSKTGVKIAPSSQDQDSTISSFDIITQHKNHDLANTPVEFSMQSAESAGTNRLFCLAVFLAKALEHGNLTLVDDLDAELHPLLVKALVEQFENKRTNPKGAQLICTTHEFFLLSPAVGLRHDQLLLTDKNNREVSELVAFTDYDDRHGYRLDSNYLIGRFGGVPSLGFDEPSIEEGSIDGKAN